MLAKRLRDKYQAELLESVIPFWMRHGVDREHGGFLTCLDRGGAVYDDRKYIWLQGRGVWTFSTLYNRVERNPEWLDIARRGAEFLRRHAFDAQGRCWFSTTRQGDPVWYQRKPYAAVFVMLGFWEYAKASGDLSYREQALSLFHRIREWIAHPERMDRPMRPAPSLADLMVVLSMATEIHTVTPAPEYRAVIEECLEGARGFFDPTGRVLMENIAPRSIPEGRLFCPGSSLEVAWFLIHGAEAIGLCPPGDPSAVQPWLDTVEATLDLGWDREFGGLHYFMDIEGRPPLPLEAPMKLWWPHTEAIYALALAWSLTKQDKWLRRLEEVDEYTFRRFADPEYGEWFGYCDRQGNLTHTLKGNNYKGCFHIPRALLYSLQRLG